MRAGEVARYSNSGFVAPRSAPACAGVTDPVCVPGESREATCTSG